MLNQQQALHPSPMDQHPCSAGSCSDQEPRDQRKPDLRRSLVSTAGDGSAADRWAITMAMSLSCFPLDDHILSTSDPTKQNVRCVSYGCPGQPDHTANASHIDTLKDSRPHHLPNSGVTLVSTTTNTRDSFKFRPCAHPLPCWLLESDRKMEPPLRSLILNGI